MANNQAIQDPSVIGVKGLKGVNTQEPEPSVFAFARNFRKEAQAGMQALSPKQAIGFVGVGDSTYDKEITSATQLEDLEDTRAKLQPWYSKIVNGLARAGVTFATTYGDYYLGTMDGLIKAGQTGKFSSFLDNPTSNLLNDVQQNIDDALPIYQTQEEMKNQANGEWYKNMAHAAFIARDVLPNLGFMAAAYVSGKGASSLVTKALRLGEARKAIQTYTMLSKDAEAASAVTGGIKAAATGDAIIDAKTIIQDGIKASKKLKWADPVLRLSGSVAGAIGESRIEAINNSNQYYDGEKGNIDTLLPDQYWRVAEELITKNPSLLNRDGTLTSEGEQQIQQQVDNWYTTSLSKVAEQKAKYANRDFWTNMALLTSSDFIQFGRMFAGGFKNANRIKNGITRVMGEEGAQTYKAATFSALKKAAAFAKTPIAEGPYEEMLQSTISNTLNNYYGSELNGLAKAQVDPKANNKAITWLNAMGEGAAQEYGTVAGWEDGFVGGLMGGFGIPTLSRTQIEGAKPKLKVNWGGSIGEYQEAKKKNQEEIDLADKLNATMSDPKRQEYYNALVRRLHFEEEKTEALDDKDEFEYKNAAHSQLISDITLYDKANRIQDLYDYVDSFANLNEDNIGGIRTLMQTKGDPDVAFKSMTDPELVDYMKKQAAKTKETIDTYRKIQDALATKAGDTFRGEDLSELTWMLTKVDDWEKRFRDVHQKLKEELSPVLEGKTYKDKEGIEHPVDEILQQNPRSLIDAFSSITTPLMQEVNKATLLGPAVEAKLQGLVQEQQAKIAAKEDEVGRASMLKKLERLQNAVKETRATNEKATDSLKDIQDLIKLSSARVSFLNRYNGYLANPERLREEMDSTKEQAAQENITDQKLQDKAKVSPIEKQLKKAKTYEEYKAQLNQLEDQEVATQATENLAKAGNTNAKLHMDISYSSADVKNKINKSDLSEEAKEVAKEYFNENAKQANSVDDLLNPSAPIYSTFITRDDGSLYNEDAVKSGLDFLRETVGSAQRKNSIKNDLTNIPKSSLKKAAGKFIPKKFRKGTEEEEVPLPGEEEVPPEEQGLEFEDGVMPTPPEEPVKKEVPVAPSPSEVISNQGKEDDAATQIVSDINNVIDQARKDVMLSQVYFSSIPELDVRDKHKGIRFIDVKGKESFTTIYNYLTEHGCWDYLNTIGNIKVGDKVGFYIDEAFNKADPTKVLANTIFITHGPNNQVIGVLKEGTIAPAVGLKALRERIWTQFNANHNNADITEHTVIRQVNPGYTHVDASKVHDLTTTPNLNKDNLVFAIGSNTGQVQVDNSSIPINKFVQPKEAKPGMMYLYLLNSDGKYYPVPLSIKRFNAQEYDLNDTVLKNSPRFKRIDGALHRIAEAKTSEDVTTGFKLLGQELSLSNGSRRVHINLSTDGYQIELKESDPDTGKFIRGYKSIPIKQQVVRDVNGVDMAEMQPVNPTDIYNELLSTIQSMNLLFNINSAKTNTPEYNKELMDSNLLKTNLVDGRPKSVWYYLNALDNEGNQIPFIAPMATPTTSKVVFTNTPVSGVERTIPGTPISYKGTQYYVNDGVPVTEDGKKATPGVWNTLLDLAYIKDGESGKFGPTFRKDHRLEDGWYKLQNGSLFNINDFTYKQAEAPKAAEVQGTKTKPLPKAPAAILIDGLDLSDFGDLGGTTITPESIHREVVPIEPYRKWSKEEELGWLQRNLPNVSKQDLIHIHKGLKTINDKGTEAWGLFNKTGIHIADGAMRGTVYHESFHLAYWMLTDANTRSAIDNDAKKIWGDLSKEALNEKMADAFTEYVETGILPKPNNKTFSSKIKNFFNQLLAFIGIKNNTNTLNNFFRQINQGEFAKNKLALDEDFYLNKQQENLDKSRKISIFDRLEPNVKQNLQLKGFNSDTWNDLTNEEKEHEVKCATI